MQSDKSRDRKDCRHHHRTHKHSNPRVRCAMLLKNHTKPAKRISIGLNTGRDRWEAPMQRNHMLLRPMTYVQHLPQACILAQTSPTEAIHATEIMHERCHLIAGHWLRDSTGFVFVGAQGLSHCSVLRVAFREGHYLNKRNDREQNHVQP